VVVVLPASMWALIPILRYWSMRVLRVMAFPGLFNPAISAPLNNDAKNILRPQIHARPTIPYCRNRIICPRARGVLETRAPSPARQPRATQRAASRRAPYKGRTGPCKYLAILRDRARWCTGRANATRPVRPLHGIRRRQKNTALHQQTPTTGPENSPNRRPSKPGRRRITESGYFFFSSLT